MIKEKRKQFILIFLLLILIVEVIFLVRRMTLDKKASQTLRSVTSEKKVIDQSIQELSQQNLENFVINQDLLKTANQTKDSVHQSIKTVDDISNISG
ncbi:hypothetical protein, partial [Vagococcus teuberi]